MWGILFVLSSGVVEASASVTCDSIAPDCSLKNAISGASTSHNCTFCGSFTDSPPALDNYGFDGNVDDEDSDKWRIKVGTTSRMIDGNDNGLVTRADCEFWRRHLGTTVDGGSSRGPPTVPEPNAVALGPKALLPILRRPRR